ncbi:MAG: fatty acid desaturase [Polyangiaceae bacterium]|nr:fatty acid desaturase [Polyangiaceae bacterium]
MLPRRTEDYRTLFWTCVLAPALVVLHYSRPELGPYLCALSCYFGLACGVIAHNHMHRPTFGEKLPNTLFSSWISVFYGYPVFAWLPTHNMNHHKFVNKNGDATITWRFTNKHNAVVAGTYFFVSAYYQGAWIQSFIKKARTQKPALFRRIVLQYSTVYGVQALMLGVAIARHGLSVGFFVWLFAMGIPAIFALWAIMLFNYTQHVHTDPWSDWNHSRNFGSWSLNFFLFGNGFHTIHHEKPSLHWSDARAEHAKVAHKMSPELIQRSFWWFMFKQHFLAILFPKLGTVQMGRAPFDPPEGAPEPDEAAQVVLCEAGSNAVKV